MEAEPLKLLNRKLIIMYKGYLSTELVESLGPIGAEGFLDLLSNHVEDLSEVLSGGAHLTPRLVNQDNAVCVELLPINLCHISCFGRHNFFQAEKIYLA